MARQQLYAVFSRSPLNRQCQIAQVVAARAPQPRRPYIPVAALHPPLPVSPAEQHRDLRVFGSIFGMLVCTVVAVIRWTDVCTAEILRCDGRSSSVSSWRANKTVRAHRMCSTKTVRRLLGAVLCVALLAALAMLARLGHLGVEQQT